uniref:Uncharacterized protein n=1 Tax=Glossina austeni TaxID=7395 RepID=A0A1A9VYK3_GLOAU
MRMRRWNIRNIAILIACSLIIYMICARGRHSYEIDGIIKNTKPEDVWNYVADFSKMKLLNPTILDFKILSESGHIHDWRYTVEYTEHLSHWPYWFNVGIGQYIVIKSMPDKQPQTYSIKSQHQTCFLKGLYCLRSESDFDFIAEAANTHCRESVRYECPLFFGGACKQEVVYQRKAIMYNLTNIFNSMKRKH